MTCADAPSAMQGAGATLERVVTRGPGKPVGASAEARRALGREVRSQAAVIGGTLAVLWLLEIVDQLVFKGRLNDLGVKPRTTGGLVGIPLHPFLHAGFGHLLANTIGLALPGWFIVNRRRRDFFVVWVCATLVGGVGTWLVGRGVTHVGASGVVMGLMGCLVVRGWFERRFLAMLASIAMAVLWGGTILGGLFPAEGHISWEVHLFGLLGGVLAAWLTRRRRIAAASLASVS
jgi:membrane associated rhomboid family serine protease